MNRSKHEQDTSSAPSLPQSRYHASHDPSSKSHARARAKMELVQRRKAKLSADKKKKGSHTTPLWGKLCSFCNT